MGAHGWVAGIASHGSVILSRGWLFTVQAPGYPRHPFFIWHDAVVNAPIMLWLVIDTFCGTLKVMTNSLFEVH